MDRANRTAIDARRAHAGKEAAVEAAITPHARAIALPAFEFGDESDFGEPVFMPHGT